MIKRYVSCYQPVGNSCHTPSDEIHSRDIISIPQIPKAQISIAPHSKCLFFLHGENLQLIKVKMKQIYYKKKKKKKSVQTDKYMQKITKVFTCSLYISAILSVYLSDMRNLNINLYFDKYKPVY